MKKMAPHIRNKQGSMLMLTLIVFMVILILGMTMITSMLYSQGENTMQINEQKAYYAALSAVEAVKNYFSNPKLNQSLNKSITSPYELIGKTCTYNLKDQGIDEDTTVELSISRDKEKEQYILIQATGICQGEKSIVTAKMFEEVQEGSSGGIYDSEAVFGTSNLQSSKDMTVTGNIYIDGDYAATINNLQMKETENQKSTLYIKNKTSLQLATSKLKDVYIETESGATIRHNEADNMYIRCVGNTANQTMTFLNNIVKGDAQLYLNQFLPNVNSNTVGNRFIFGFNRDILGNRIIIQNTAEEFYIKGVGKFTNDDGVDSTSGIGKIYIDDNTQVSENFKLSYQLTDLSNLFASEEQRISTVISGLSEVGKVLKTKPSWDKEAIRNRYPEMSEKDDGILKKDSVNKYFEEYYDVDTNTRWVFTKDKSEGGWYTIKNKTNENWASESTYYISNDPIHENDTIFFVNSNSGGVNMQLSSENIRLDNVHIYAPSAYFTFLSQFEYFGGSIIAKGINTNGNGPKEAEFKAPKKEIQITGAPSLSGDSNNTGSSSGTTYSYKFESYVDFKKVS